MSTETGSVEEEEVSVESIDLGTSSNGVRWVTLADGTKAIFVPSSANLIGFDHVVVFGLETLQRSGTSLGIGYMVTLDTGEEYKGFYSTQPLEKHFANDFYV